MTDTRTAIVSCQTYIRQERDWPHQWIGTCRCGKGIRCNDQETVLRFFDREGCRPRPSSGRDES